MTLQIREVNLNLAEHPFSVNFFFLSPLGATIASVYETARFTMPGYASFLWGAGQAFIGFLVSYTRVLATL